MDKLLVLMEGPMSKNIAIIGCGIFGAQIALRLSSQSHKVTIFEKDEKCLMGASSNNQNRLHLGFHYPRDINTARQCIKGFDRFINEFPSCVDSNFNNAYFISSKNSLTSTKQYKEFCKELKIYNDPIDIDKFQVKVNNVDYGVLTEEAVYDCKILREIMVERLSFSDVKIINNCNVDDIKKSQNSLKQLFSENKSLGEYDSVINCTYANINSLTKKLGYSVNKNQYEYTFTPIIKINIPKVGITIMDGHFTTLLPYGKSDKFLLYHVEHSVIKREIGEEIDPSWLDKLNSPLKAINIDEHFSNMLNDCAYFIPCLKKAKLVGYLSGPRMVKAKSDDTDERPSNVNIYDESYCTVYSGKIDHCVWVADKVSDWVNS